MQGYCCKLYREAERNLNPADRTTALLQRIVVLGNCETHEINAIAWIVAYEGGVRLRGNTGVFLSLPAGLWRSTGLKSRAEAAVLPVSSTKDAPFRRKQ